MNRKVSLHHVNGTEDARQGTVINTSGQTDGLENRGQVRGARLCEEGLMERQQSAIHN